MLFRVRLTLKSPLGTGLSSGTLFGQLCWMKRECESEQALVRWLAEPTRLWAVSDGFPAGLLPRPMLAPAPRSSKAGEDQKAADEAKREKKLPFVTRDGFIAVRDNLSDAALRPYLRAVEDATHTLAHNTIDRLTGSTPETGGLYFLREDWSHSGPRRTDEEGEGGAQAGRAAPKQGAQRELAQPSSKTLPAGPERDVYVTADQPSEKKAIRALFTALGERGLGRDASLGRGQWTVTGVKDEEKLGKGSGSRLMSLSRGSAEGLESLRCRLAPHFGKLGPQLAVGEGASPFKKTLLLTLPGATFSGRADGCYGEWLTGVHPTRTEVGHNALHVVLPFREALDAP